MTTARTRPAGPRKILVIMALLLGLALVAGMALVAVPAGAAEQRSSGAPPAAPAATDTPSASPTCVAGGAPGPFGVVQHMPTPAADPGFSSDGRYAYAAGGYDIAGGRSLNQFARYDPTGDSWVTLAALPISVTINSLVYAPANNKLYSFGGGDDGCNALVATQIYDIGTGTWSAGADLPAPRLGFAGAGYANGKIYLSGGELSCDNTTAQAQTWIYDIAANTWMTGTVMPQAMTSAASGVVNGRLYVLGGSTSSNTVLNTIYDYNVTADTWATATTTLLAPAWVAGAAVANGRIWVIGGDDFIQQGPLQAPGARRRTGQGSTNSKLAPNATLGVSQIFDPAAGSVSWGPFLNLARQELGAAAVGNAIVAAGGFNGGNPNGDFSLDITERATLANPCAGSGTPSPTPPAPSGTPTCVTGATHNPWAVASPAPTVSFLPGVAADGTYAYAAGGSDGTMHDQFARYNPATDSWTTLAPLPVAANGVGLVYAPINNKLYAFGGTDVITHALDLTSIYDIASGTWSSGAPLPNPRSRFAGAGYWDGKIYLVGGTNPATPDTSQNDTWEYDVLHDTWTIKLPIPIPLADAASAVVDGHLYVIGGRTRQPPTLNTVYAYDIAHDFWTLLDARLPTNVWYPGGTAVQGRVWVVGGQRGAATHITQIFDPRTGTFSEGPSLNVARYGLGAATVGNFVVAVGGYASGAEGLATTEVTTQLPDCPPAATPTVTATATPCALSFSDVPAGYWAYGYIQWAYCHGIISGYADGTFRPESATTRSQIAKMVVLAAGFPLVLPPGAPHFADVSPSNPFYPYVEVAYAQGIVSGYGDGTFHPYANVTRAQLAKMIVVARGLALVTPGTPTYDDVTPAYWAYRYIETATAHNLVGGYDCLRLTPAPTPAPPCRTFRPAAAATRAQWAKMLYQAFGLPSRR